MVEVPAAAAELVELCAIVVGAAGMTVVGVFLEQFGFEAAVSGDLVLGLWAAGMGLLALYVGVVALGYEQALPRLRRMAGSD